MFCVKCGAILKQGKCPECGFVDDTFNEEQEATEGSEVAKEQDKRKTKINKTKEKKPKEKKPKEEKPSKGKLKALLSKEKAREKRTLTKKRKRVIIIIATASAIVIGVGAFLAVYFIKDAKYQEAISYLENDRPETAKQEFEELKSFKESEQYLEDCNTLIAYYDAVDTYEDAKYEDALDKFEKLGRYKDSEDYTELCQDYIDYNGAKDFFDAESFEQAKAIYVALGDFKDSVDMATSCQNNIDYNQAQMLFEADDYEGAKRLFVGIPELKDSEDMVFICECLIDYKDAMDAYTKESYHSAARMFEELYNTVRASRVDFKGTLEHSQVKYFEGQCYYNQDLFYSAYQAFKSAGGYEDSSSMASKCEQPIDTKELYINPQYTRNSVKMTFYAPETGNEDICIKVYNEDDGELVSICYVKNDEKLKVYFPSGTYYYKICYGTTWYGEKESFGKEFYRATFEDGSDTQRLHSDYYYWINF